MDLSYLPTLKDSPAFVCDLSLLRKNLELLNLVLYRYTSVNVYGTDADDDFEFDASSGVAVTINGVAYPIGNLVNLVTKQSDENCSTTTSLAAFNTQGILPPL